MNSVVQLGIEAYWGIRCWAFDSVWYLSTFVLSLYGAGGS